MIELIFISFVVAVAIKVVIWIFRREEKKFLVGGEYRAWDELSLDSKKPRWHEGEEDR